MNTHTETKFVETLPDGSELSAVRNLNPLEVKLALALKEMICEARERNKAAGCTVFNPAALEVAVEALKDVLFKVNGGAQ